MKKFTGGLILDWQCKMNLFLEMYKESASKEAYAESYIRYLTEVLEKISTKEVADFIDALIAASVRGSTIYFIGNGGSASTASHFVNDLSIGTKTINNHFRAISLCDNQAVITAIANDYGYEYIFSKQLDVLLKKEDLVVAISASGNSTNLMHAIDSAKQKGAITIGLTAFDGGKLSQEADITVHVPTKKGEYGPSEDAHMVLDHLVSSYLINFVKDEIK
jgi:D-sedoheptulose 7-phosphate isomerase